MSLHSGVRYNRGSFTDIHRDCYQRQFYIPSDSFVTYSGTTPAPGIASTTHTLQRPGHRLNAAGSMPAVEA